LVVSVNDPPRVGMTDSEEVRRIEANANRAQRWAEEQHQAVPLCSRDLRLEFEESGLLTFNSPQANLGAALARLQLANPSLEAEAAMAYSCHHNSGGGEERGVQVGCIYVEPALAQPI
jgi:hypothetical protein